MSTEIESWSNKGPVCPKCGATWSTDEAFYYDENGYDLDCDDCGIVVHVAPYVSWSFTCTAENPEPTN